MTLEILISTYGEGIAQTAQVLTDSMEGVSYLIVWQHGQLTGDAVPDILYKRSDVRIITSETRGISISRNIAIENAMGDILLIADDDVIYTPDAFKRIIEHYEADPSLDIATFQATNYDGQPLRQYPTHSFAYGNRPKGTYFCSFEISMKRSTRLPKFDLRFGIGAPLMGCGEEEVFIHQAHLDGLNIQCFPEVILKTDENTTGRKFNISADVRRAKGGVLCFIYGSKSATLRCLKHALCAPDVTDRWRALCDMWAGIRIVKQTPHA